MARKTANLIPLDIYRVESTLLASLTIVPPGKMKLEHPISVVTEDGEVQLPVFRMSGDRDQLKAQLAVQIDYLFDAYEKALKRKN